MFTGIIQTLAEVKRMTDQAGIRRLEIALGEMADRARPGDSISINGVCLTVTNAANGTAAFDVIPETLARSNLGGLRTGDRVNAEASLRADGKLDGHFVQGHVDGIATTDRIDQRGGEYRIAFTADPDLLRYIVPKGSVALDGVSMTVADVQPGRFSVALIPTTLRETTLGLRRPGDTVNVETDILVRTVAHLLERDERAQRGAAGAGITLDALREHGFTHAQQTGRDTP